MVLKDDLGVCFRIIPHILVIRITVYIKMRLIAEQHFTDLEIIVYDHCQHRFIKNHS